MSKASKGVFSAEKALKFIKYVTGALIVSKCPSCGELVRHRGTLCAECLEKYTTERQTGCKYCTLPATECVCSTRELKICKFFDKSFHSLLFYDREFTVFQSVLYRLKKDADRSAEVFFARELSIELLKLASETGQHLPEWYITFPPRTKNAILDYGFDQSEGLAKRIAKYTGMTFEKIFIRSRHAKKPQKDLGGEMRRANAESMFYIDPKADVKGKKFIIVDDVITTGATVLQCQRLLLKAGAKAVFPLSISKTYFKGPGFDRKTTRRKRVDTAWFM